jgi:hypothetical protein
MMQSQAIPTQTLAPAQEMEVTAAGTFLELLFPPCELVDQRRVGRFLGQAVGLPPVL